jgi:hypothetical protein
MNVRTRNNLNVSAMLLSLHNCHISLKIMIMVIIYLLIAGVAWTVEWQYASPLCFHHFQAPGYMQCCQGRVEWLQCNVQVAGGPKIDMLYGRTDLLEKECGDTTRLPAGNAPFPNADGPAEHLRNVFYPMGFNDQEIVALSGAHTLGRAFKNRSGVPSTICFLHVIP